MRNLYSKYQTTKPIATPGEVSPWHAVLGFDIENNSGRPKGGGIVIA